MSDETYQIYFLDFVVGKQTMFSAAYLHWFPLFLCNAISAPHIVGLLVTRIEHAAIRSKPASAFLKNSPSLPL